MGCWNQTCGISNLYIGYREPVVIFPVQRENRVDSFSYGTALYKPALLPFYGTYDDYGSAEDCTGAALPVLMNELKRELIEMPVGENPYHDIAVKRAGFGLREFFNATHERRLFVKDIWGNPANVEFMMVHKKIFDHILEHHVCEDMWAQDGKFHRRKYKFADVLADIPEWIKSFKEVMASDKYALYTFDLYRIMEKSGKRNLAAEWMRFDQFAHAHSFVRYREVINSLIEDENTITQVVEEILKGAYINGFMHKTRKLWTPQAGQGSQEQDQEPYRLLIKAMNKVLKEDKAKWEEWNGE